MPTGEEIKRLEQVWLVLSDLFQDLNLRNISVDVASDLRDCRTLIHLIRSSIAPPSKERMTVDNSLRNLLQILDKIRSHLISAALRLDESYVRGWIEKIDRAERAESDYPMTYTPSEFIPDLPKDPEEGWVRLTLKRPIAEERVQDVAEQFGVIIEFIDDCRISISGRRDSVKKATRDVYELSLEEASFRRNTQELNAGILVLVSDSLLSIHSPKALYEDEFRGLMFTYDILVALPTSANY